MSELKAIVTVVEMARMLNLSRSRFYQLLREGVFPAPLRNPQSGRPYYTAELQQACLDVRRRNLGINGQPVLFYARQIKSANVTPKPKSAEPKQSNYEDVLEGVQALGLATTAKQVEQVIAASYPSGIDDVDRGEVIREVFLSLMRQESKR